MRGIVILEVLRRVQKELGGQIQFQEFFDLIVGTRSVEIGSSACMENMCPNKLIVLEGFLLLVSA